MNDGTTQTSLVSGPQRLGSRALSLIVSRHARFALVVLVIAIAAFIARGMVGNTAFMDQVVMWSIILFVVFLVWAFLAGYLVYANYTFSLEDDAFKIRQGVLSKREIAIPYRQIRDVSIERSLTQQIAGVSKLIILTTGSGSSDSSEDAPIIDNIDKNLALASQSELLKRANVQKISQS